MILTAWMAHPRKVIRDAVVARLTNATAAGARVFAMRVEPYKTTAVPVISVYTLSESIDAASASTSPRELTRELKVEIAGWVRDTSALPVGDAIDVLSEQIEAAMNADPYLGGTAGDSVLDGTEMTIRDDGDPLLGIVSLTYSVTYRTFVDQAVAVDDFLRAGVTTQIDGAGTDNVASDLVNVQEVP